MNQELAIAALNSPALGAVVSIGGTVAGYFVRAYQSKSEARTQIASKAIELQQFLAEMAFDEQRNIQWRLEKPQWAVDTISKQIAIRMDDLAIVANTAKLGPSIAPLLGVYREAIQQFLKKWFVTEARFEGEHDGFWNRYHDTKKALHELLKALKRFKRIERVLIADGISDFNHTKDSSGTRRKNPFGYSTSSESPNSTRTR